MTPRNSLKTVFISVSALAGLMVMTAPASADELVFKYKRYELETAAGAEALYHRLERRASSTCSDWGPRPIQKKIAEKKCTASMISQAVDRIDHPRLNEMHARAGGAERLAQYR